MEDLAPRIKDLKAQMDKLEEKRLDLMEAIRDVKGDLLEASVVTAYVNDLTALLSKGSIVEQKSFLRSFVKQIKVNLPQVVINYTMPLKAQKVEPLDREVLPFVYDGSPSKLKARTFRATYRLPDVEKTQKIKVSQPVRQHRNPIVLAREWQRMLTGGECSSLAALARRLGFSRARVTQVLRLLRLAPQVLDAVTDLGDPLPSLLLSERKLRVLVNLALEEQYEGIKIILADQCRGPQ